jgi:hypothetical protein
MCYSDGIRSGIVQKFSKKGLLVKSWEGELVMEGNKFNQASGGNVWKFSVSEPTVATVVETATMNGNVVSLKYCQAYFNVGTTDTDYRIIEAIEKVKK